MDEHVGVVAFHFPFSIQCSVPSPSSLKPVSQVSTTSASILLLVLLDDMWPPITISGHWSGSFLLTQVGTVVFHVPSAIQSATELPTSVNSGEIQLKCTTTPILRLFAASDRTCGPMGSGRQLVMAGRRNN